MTTLYVLETVNEAAFESDTVDVIAVESSIYSLAPKLAQLIEKLKTRKLRLGYDYIRVSRYVAGSAVVRYAKVDEIHAVKYGVHKTIGEFIRQFEE